MQELTLVELGTPECTEVYFNIDTETGEVGDIYCFTDDVPEDEDLCPVGVTLSELNPLFSNISLKEFKRVSSNFGLSCPEGYNLTSKIMGVLDDLGIMVYFE